AAVPAAALTVEAVVAAVQAVQAAAVAIAASALPVPPHRSSPADAVQHRAHSACGSLDRAPRQKSGCLCDQAKALLLDQVPLRLFRTQPWPREELTQPARVSCCSAERVWLLMRRVHISSARHQGIVCPTRPPLARILQQPDFAAPRTGHCGLQFA